MTNGTSTYSSTFFLLYAIFARTSAKGGSALKLPLFSSLLIYTTFYSVSIVITTDFVGENSLF